MLSLTMRTNEMRRIVFTMKMAERLMEKPLLLNGLRGKTGVCILLKGVLNMMNVINVEEQGTGLETAQSQDGTTVVVVVAEEEDGDLLHLDAGHDLVLETEGEDAVGVDLGLGIADDVPRTGEVAVGVEANQRVVVVATRRGEGKAVAPPKIINEVAALQRIVKVKEVEAGPRIARVTANLNLGVSLRIERRVPQRIERVHLEAAPDLGPRVLPTMVMIRRKKMEWSRILHKMMEMSNEVVVVLAVEVKIKDEFLLSMAFVLLLFFYRSNLLLN